MQSVGPAQLKVWPYMWKINGSADIMAAFHTQKRLGGVFITTLPFKNILWSNHISSTTLLYGIHVIKNLQSVKPDSLIWEDCVATVLMSL